VGVESVQGKWEEMFGTKEVEEEKKLAKRRATSKSKASKAKKKVE
jgi:hypothetical protein